MFMQKQFVVFNVLAYSLLIFLFHEFHHGKTIDEKCLSHSCMRFCCEIDTVCDTDYVVDNFNSSAVPWFWRESEEGPHKIYPVFDQLKCPLVEVEQKWQFTGVSSLDSQIPPFIHLELTQSGAIKTADGERHSYSSFCLRDSSDGEVVTWRLMMCQTSDKHHFSRDICRIFGFI
jgi:hypothetical protein